MRATAVSPGDPGCRHDVGGVGEHRARRSARRRRRSVGARTPVVALLGCGARRPRARGVRGRLGGPLQGRGGGAPARARGGRARSRRPSGGRPRRARRGRRRRGRAPALRGRRRGHLSAARHPTGAAGRRRRSGAGRPPLRGLRRERDRERRRPPGRVLRPPRRRLAGHLRDRRRDARDGGLHRGGLARRWDVPAAPCARGDERWARGLSGGRLQRTGRPLPLGRHRDRRRRHRRRREPDRRPVRRGRRRQPERRRHLGVPRHGVRAEERCLPRRRRDRSACDPRRRRRGRIHADRRHVPTVRARPPAGDQRQRHDRFPGGRHGRSVRARRRRPGGSPSCATRCWRTTTASSSRRG